MKRFLHVGCGHSRIDATTPGFRDGGWEEIRYDIDPACGPDIVGSMTDMSSVADGSVDALFSSHTIEHLYAHEVPAALAEFVRVIRDDGFCVVTCPDLQSVCELVANDRLTETAYESPAGPIAAIDILYGHRAMLAQGRTFMAHRCGFTRKVLRASLFSSGFASVALMRRARSFDLWAVACKSARGGEAMTALARAHFPAPRA